MKKILLAILMIIININAEENNLASNVFKLLGYQSPSEQEIQFIDNNFGLREKYLFYFTQNTLKAILTDEKTSRAFIKDISDFFGLEPMTNISYENRRDVQIILNMMPIKSYEFILYTLNKNQKLWQKLADNTCIKMMNKANISKRVAELCIFGLFNNPNPSYTDDYDSDESDDYSHDEYCTCDDCWDNSCSDCSSSDDF